MNSWKKIIPFLILNVLISGLTTLAVLSIWNNSAGWNLTSSAHISQASAIPTIVNTPEPLPSLDDPVIKIESIIGPGNATTEAVRLVRMGTDPLWLTGWKLSNQSGIEFIFPELALLKEGAFVEVYSRSGHNTPFELYWNRVEPVWKSGGTATLVDSAGNIRAEYSIP